MTFDPYRLIKYHLYLLQLENYELGRFWKLLFKRGWFPPKEQRKNLVWTQKAILLFVISEILILALAAIILLKGFSMPFAFFWQKLFTFLVVVYILDFFTPIFVCIASIILWPIDWAVKTILVMRARAKIKSLSVNLDSGSGAGMTHSGLKIIGIAGSYGKTTMKDVLSAVLSSGLKIAATPESINTPVGIARWILKSVSAETRVLIVEMGEHYKGDVEDICDITKPDIVVVTGINEAHLERMKTMENLEATIFEIVSGAKSGATVLLNADDKRVMENYKKYVWPDHKVEEYRVSSFESRVFNPEKLVWEAQDKNIGKFEVNLLGEYALGNADAGIKIATALGVSGENIKKGIAKIKPVEHRLQSIRSAGGVLVIDDSYNGNPDGVKEAIAVLGRFANRRKIYITPGLVEIGKREADVHREIGKQLAEVADVVILIRNSVTPWIAEGMALANKQIGKSAAQIIWFESAVLAHAGLKDILKPNDVILFQNDWGDNYV